MIYPTDDARYARPLPSAPAALRLWVDGQPLPKRRPRMGKNGAYTPAETRRYETDVAWQLRAAMGRVGPVEGDVALALVFYRKGKRRADLDNLQKAFWDAANGVLYQDDKQVVSVAARVVYDSDKPGTEVVLRKAA